jgi:hypothetical protein
LIIYLTGTACHLSEGEDFERQNQSLQVYLLVFHVVMRGDVKFALKMSFFDLHDEQDG